MKKRSNINEKKICGRFTVAMVAAMLTVTPVHAADAGFAKVVAPIISLLNSLIGPMLGLVSAVGALYCILLGVKFAKAEEPQDREKAKSHLKNAIIGFVLIFVLMAALNIAMPNLAKWAETYTGTDINITKGA